MFVHLLPKLASTQEKFTGVPISEASELMRNHLYLVALVGLVLVYWLESAASSAPASVFSGFMPCRAEPELSGRVVSARTSALGSLR